MFSKNLRYLRNKFNMDQIDLAEMLGRRRECYRCIATVFIALLTTY